MKLSVVITALVLLSASTAFAGGAKTYQVTGPVLEVRPNMVVVQKGKDKWEIDRDHRTKVKGDLKVGSKVKVMYKMEAVSIEAKSAKKKKK
jgi:hypothetical protein